MEGFAEAFVKERGGKIIQQQWVPPTATDYSSFILGMNKADAAVVFFVGTAVVPFFSQYGELGKMPVIETYSEIEFPELIKELGSAPARIPVTSDLPGFIPIRARIVRRLWRSTDRSTEGDLPILPF